MGEPNKLRLTLPFALQQRVPESARHQSPDLSIRPQAAFTSVDLSSDTDETLGSLDQTQRAHRVPDNTWLPRLSIDDHLLADAQAAHALASDFLSPCDFEVIDELGRGGMGVVQRARQRTLRREVALKRARTLLPANNALLHEAQITGSLEHPHIIPIHALGLDQHSQPVLVMKCVEGVVWRALIHDPLHPWWERLGAPQDQLIWHIERLIQVCEAIAFAHRRNVIHRDLKPDNVMIGAFGELYVLDWGVAIDLSNPDPSAPEGQSSGFVLVGTPAYMPPEMINGAPPVSFQSDIYLLGGILHEILTGEPPHAGEGIFEVLQNASNATAPLLPDAHPELAAICVQALHANPSSRFASVSAFKQALRSYLQHRAAYKLIEQATAQVPTLQALCESPKDNLPDIQRLFIESRFALKQALQDLPSDPTAQTTLTQTLSLMIRTELSLGNLHAARSLLADLPSPSEVLTGLVTQAEQAASLKQAELSSLKALAHHLDTRVATRQRAILTLVLALFWAFLVALAVFAHRLLGYEPTYTEALGAAVGGLLMAIGGMYALRNAFQFHKLNRQVMAIFAATVTFATIFRGLGWFLGLPLLITLNLELLPIALATFIGALSLDHRIIPPAVLCLLCGLAGVLAPVIAPETYLLGQFGCLIWIAYIWYKAPQQSPPSVAA